MSVKFVLFDAFGTLVRIPKATTPIVKFSRRASARVAGRDQMTFTTSWLVL
jgi:hypothetical protein